MATNVTEIKDMLLDAGLDLEKELSEADDAALGFPTPQAVGDLGMFLYIDQIPEVITWSLMNPTLHNQTLCFLGASAIGKTESIRAGFREAAKQMGREGVFKELHVSQMGPTDVMGVPREDGNGRTIWYPPQMFPLQSAHQGHEADYQAFLADWQATGKYNWEIMQPHPLYGLFFDEVTNPSQPSIVHQCFSIWMGKYVADHPMVSDLFTVLAGNRVQDGTNSINLANSATSRLGLVETAPRFSGWLKSYAMKQEIIGGEQQTKVHPLVIAYLYRQPDRFAPSTSGKPQMEPFPSPRTWTFVSELLYAHDRNPLPEEILMSMVASRIGHADTRNFWAFRQYWRDLPDVNKLLNSKEEANGYGWLPKQWPRQQDIQIILGTQMVGKLNEHNAKRFMKFLLDREKFSPETAAMAMKLLRPSGKLQDLAHKWARVEFAEFATKYKTLLF